MISPGPQFVDLVAGADVAQMAIVCELRDFWPLRAPDRRQIPQLANNPQLRLRRG
jgi:hypothetical protein